MQTTCQYARYAFGVAARHADEGTKSNSTYQNLSTESKMQRKTYLIRCKYKALFLARYAICPDFYIEFGTNSFVHLEKSAFKMMSRTELLHFETLIITLIFTFNIK